MTDDLFIAGGGNESITIPGRSPGSIAPGELNQGDATVGFFTTMRVPLRRGRYLEPADAEEKIRALWKPIVTDLSLADKERLATPEPAVVNEAFVRRYFPGEDPIGKRFCIDPTNKTYWYVIVGVVGDMHRQGLEHTTIPEYFGTYIPSPNGRADLVVRTAGDPLALASAVRRVVIATIPNVVIANVSTASAQLGDFTAQRRLQTWLLSAFAFLALVLAAVGIYGLVHYTVADRMREIGVRIALGASPADVLALVIGQGMRMPLLGVTLGLVASLGVTRVLSHLLYGLTATDPVTYAAVAVTLALVAALACWLPARRATHVDPIGAIRG
jgi:putative ABC transport system permease protein